MSDLRTLSSRSRQDPSESTIVPSSYESPDATNPTSTYLQDMIREKKAQTQRFNKVDRLSRTQDLDYRETQSSPLGAKETRPRPSMRSRQTSATGVKSQTAPRDMGVREMQEYVTKLDKQNFDLKLEIFHRRQRTEVLEAKVNKMEELEADNEEIHGTNEQLLMELERRDLAIKEAVTMICELEAKIEDMKSSREDARHMKSSPRPDGSLEASPSLSSSSRMRMPESPRDTMQGSNYRKQSPVRGLAFPARTDTLSPNLSKAPRRVPSFLREDKKSTVALRSLYASGNPSFVSLQSEGVFSEEDEDELERQMLNSPRLSILSESGFSSVFGDLRDRSNTPHHENGSPGPISSPVERNPPGRANGQRIDSQRTEIGTVDSRLQNGENSFSNASSLSRLGASPDPSSSQRENRIDDWVNQSNVPSTPPRKSAKAGANDRFSSIGEILEKVPSSTKDRRSDKGTPERERGSGMTRGHQEVQKPSRDRSAPSSPGASIKPRIATSQPTSNGGSVYGGQLPPTPGTMSTATIGGNSSSQSIITEKSLLDGPPLSLTGFPANPYRGRPQTSDSGYTYDGSNAFGFDDDTGLETSDDGLQSTRVEAPDDLGLSPASPFTGGSTKASHIFGAGIPSRPALTTYTTDMMFNGEGLALVQPSRTTSYPSPARRSSNTQSTADQRNSVRESNRDGQLSPKESLNKSSNTATSLVPSANPQPRSPPVSQHTNSQMHPDTSAQTDLDSKVQRTSSLRFRIPKLASPANAFFRRANSQSTNIVLDPETDPVSRPPPVSRATSSTQARPRLPRPSSVHGQHPHRTPPSKHPQRNPSSKISSMLPNGMLTESNHPVHRPGTSDGTSQFPIIRDRRPSDIRRHSAIVDDQDVMSSLAKEAPAPVLHAWRTSESRQSSRNEDANGKGGVRGMGRSASAKIREGFGFGR